MRRSANTACGFNRRVPLMADRWRKPLCSRRHCVNDLSGSSGPRAPSHPGSVMDQHGIRRQIFSYADRYGGSDIRASIARRSPWYTSVESGHLVRYSANMFAALRSATRTRVARASPETNYVAHRGIVLSVSITKRRAAYQVRLTSRAQSDCVLLSHGQSSLAHRHV
jgi:hypothetical protein